MSNLGGTGPDAVDVAEGIVGWSTSDGEFEPPAADAAITERWTEVMNKCMPVVASLITHIHTYLHRHIISMHYPLTYACTHTH